MTFLKNSDLPYLLEESRICTIDVVGLYSSIPNKEGLRNVLERRSNKNVSIDTLIELSELVPQKN